MRSARTGLVVPIRDRRQRRRILTLKNFRNAMVVLALILAGITIQANLRRPRATDDFGRLSRTAVQAGTLVKQPEVIQEGAVADETAADPTLVQAAARAQFLYAGSNAPAPQTSTVAPVDPTTQTAAAPVARDAHVTLVGGPEGVSVVKENRARPELGGGFGVKP